MIYYCPQGWLNYKALTGSHNNYVVKPPKAGIVLKRVGELPNT